MRFSVAACAARTQVRAAAAGRGVYPTAAAMLAALLGGCAGPAPAGTARRLVREHPAMGTLFRIVVHCDEPGRAERACARAFARVDALAAAMSDYDRGSELSLLPVRAAGGPAPVSDDLLAVLALAQEVSAGSDGAFDVTVGPVVALWRRARRQGVLPAAERLAAARAAVGWQHLEVDLGRRTVRCARPGMRLDLGGIAKGYAAQAALATLRAEGCPSALVDAGGDLALGDPPPGEAGWLVALPDAAGVAREGLRLARCAVATSGDLFRYAEIDGVRYAHIVDPRTGVGLVGPRAATVIAPDAALADALASAACVLEPERAVEVVDRFAGASVLIRRGVGAAVVERASAGFPARVPAPRAGKAAPDGATVPGAGRPEPATAVPTSLRP